MNSTETIVTSNATTTAEGSGYAATAIQGDGAAVVAEVGAPPVVKTPSKKSIATAIFKAKLIERDQSLFASNKEFRKSVISTIMADLEVSLASASTMYNAAKSEAEASDASIVLGRDPKKVVVKVGDGKRGRPAGSKNKEKEADVTVVVTDPAINEAIMGTTNVVVIDMVAVEQVTTPGSESEAVAA